MSAEDLSFPFIRLEKAIDRARKAYDIDPSGTQPVAMEELLRAWDMAPKSSNYPQTVNALKGYGIVDSSRATATGVMLTNDAMSYFSEDDHAFRAQALRGFALAHPTLRRLWDSWGTTKPVDDTRLRGLIRQGLAEPSAKSLLSIYAANVAFADLADDGSVAVTQVPVVRAREAAPAIEVSSEGSDDIQVTLANGRIRIVADLGFAEDGLVKLGEVIVKYREIAGIMGR